MTNTDWKETKTKNGYPADEVISALQKEIRRGKTEEAAFWTYELYISGQEFQNKLWERLKTIAVEDIGLANPLAPLIVKSSYDNYCSPFDNEDDRLIQVLFATVYLTKSPKDRFIDELKTYFKTLWSKKPIPEYAVDKHTKRGKDLGRDDMYFWEEGAKIFPEVKNRDKKYLNAVVNHLRHSSKTRAC